MCIFIVKLLIKVYWLGHEGCHLSQVVEVHKIVKKNILKYDY